MHIPRFVVMRAQAVKSGDRIRPEGEKPFYAWQVKDNKFCRTPTALQASGMYGLEAPKAVAPYLEKWEELPPVIEVEVNVWEDD